MSFLSKLFGKKTEVVEQKEATVAQQEPARQEEAQATPAQQKLVQEEPAQQKPVQAEPVKTAPQPQPAQTPSGWRERFGKEVAEEGTCFLVIETTYNSMSPKLWNVLEDGIQYNGLFGDWDLLEKYKADFCALMEDPGIHIYRYEDGRVTDERVVRKYNVELSGLNLGELILFQEYGLFPADEKRKDVLQESLKAEKVKNTLVYACYENDTEKIFACLERASKTQLDKKLGYVGTPLGLCVENQNFQAFKAIAEKGANIGKRSIAATPLNMAFSSSLEDFVFYIYENYREQFDKEVGKEGFLIACGTKSEKLLKLLLDYGCDIHGAGKQFPPLHSFADCNNVVGLRFLLEHGADINEKNSYGQTALDRAMKGSRMADARKFLEEYIEAGK